MPASKSLTIWSTSEDDGLYNKEILKKLQNDLPKSANNLGLPLRVINGHEYLVLFDFGKFRLAHDFVSVLVADNITLLKSERFIAIHAFRGIIVFSQILWLDFKGHHFYEIIEININYFISNF